MDRIQEVTPVKAEFIPDTIIENPDDYFYDVIGVTIPKGGKIEKVVLRFSEPRYPYIKAKPIHPTQQNNDVERTITLKLIPNKELTATILGFGKDVEILEPLALRDEITSILGECCKIYGLLKNDCTSPL